MAEQDCFEFALTYLFNKYTGNIYYVPRIKTSDKNKMMRSIEVAFVLMVLTV